MCRAGAGSGCWGPGSPPLHWSLKHRGRFGAAVGPTYRFQSGLAVTPARRTTLQLCRQAFPGVMKRGCNFQKLQLRRLVLAPQPTHPISVPIQALLYNLVSQIYATHFHCLIPNSCTALVLHLGKVSLHMSTPKQCPGENISK